MSNNSLANALINKLYNSVIETAKYTCTTLNKKNIVELANNDPSFDKILEICEQLLSGLREYKDVDRSFEQAEEVVSILEEIIVAIKDDDDSVLVDCTCHLEQFLEINVRKQA